MVSLSLVVVVCAGIVRDRQDYMVDVPVCFGSTVSARAWYQEMVGEGGMKYLHSMYSISK